MCLTLLANVSEQYVGMLKKSYILRVHYLTVEIVYIGLEMDVRAAGSKISTPICAVTNRFIT